MAYYTAVLNSISCVPYASSLFHLYHLFVSALCCHSSTLTYPHVQPIIPAVSVPLVPDSVLFIFHMAQIRFQYFSPLKLVFYLARNEETRNSQKILFHCVSILCSILTLSKLLFHLVLVLLLVLSSDQFPVLFLFKLLCSFSLVFFGQKILQFFSFVL